MQVKTGDDGKMFGAVTAGMIADQLKTQFDIALDKKKIHLEHPIKTLGEHEIELHLHPEVKATLKVRVESLTPLAVPAEAPRTGDRDRDRDRRDGPARTESRGHKRAERVREEPAAPAAEEKPKRPEKKPRPAPAEKVEKPAKSEKSEKAEKPE